METGHPSTRAVNSGSGNRALYRHSNSYIRRLSTSIQLSLLYKDPSLCARNRLGMVGVPKVSTENCECRSRPMLNQQQCQSIKSRHRSLTYTQTNNYYQMVRMIFLEISTIQNFACTGLNLRYLGNMNLSPGVQNRGARKRIGGLGTSPGRESGDEVPQKGWGSHEHALYKYSLLSFLSSDRLNHYNSRKRDSCLLNGFISDCLYAITE